MSDKDWMASKWRLAKRDNRIKLGFFMMLNLVKKKACIAASLWMYIVNEHIPSLPY